MWTSKVHNSLLSMWNYLDAWWQSFASISMPLWVFIAVILVVMFVTVLDLIRLNKRDNTMGRLRRRHAGGKVDVAVWKAVSTLKLKDEITDKDFLYWCRFFSWHGFSKFQSSGKKIEGNKAEWLKKKIMQRLGEEGSDKKVNLPG